MISRPPTSLADPANPSAKLQNQELEEAYAKQQQLSKSVEIEVNVVLAKNGMTSSRKVVSALITCELQMGGLRSCLEKLRSCLEVKARSRAALYPKRLLFSLKRFT